MRIGYIGIGIMGRPMAENLLKAGYSVSVFNRTQAKCEPLRGQGATLWQSAAQVTRESDVICINVTDTPDVEQILFGELGVAEAARPGLIVVDNSTISPSATQDFAQRLEAQGVAYLDAPVSGGDVGAQKGTLSIMVGGDKAVFDQCLPLFEVLGSTVTHVGAVGMGQTCKACNQLFCALHMLACCEGVDLARKAGLDPAVMVDVVSSGAGGSWALQNLGPKIVDNDMAPGFMIDLLCKDLNYTAELGKDYDMPLTGMTLAKKLFDAVQAKGFGRLGTQGLWELFK
ncbi:MAG: NAD(P)-dependent oxidoreductase [Phycisphaeraceae bacterium]|nr:NAD(P)-dependent oxidoreductase [Phycisphaeraceae bacterium]